MKAATVTHLLRSHLQNYHHVKHGFLLQKYLNLAAEYQGKQEVKRLPTELLARPSKSTATATSTQFDFEGKHEVKRLTGKPLERPSTSTATVTSTQSSTQTTTEASPSPSSSPSKSISSNVIEPSGSEDEEHYPAWQAFFAEPKPRNDRHRWLTLFYEHLTLPDCRRKKTKNRLQHAEHIRTH